jgi:DNA-binding NtrC family response regulator
MMAKTLRDILTVKGFQADAVYSGPEALEKVETEHYDCVLSDIKMPDLNGVELFRSIKSRQPDLPVVLMTAYAADTLVQEGLQEGVIANLTKPLDINLLLNFFSSLHRERSIAIVDDDPHFCQTLGDILRARGFKVTSICDPHTVEDKLQADEQVVLLDMKLNHISGLDVLQEIRRRYPYLPVILVTAYRGEMAIAIEAALELDAYACFYKPLQIEKLFQTLNTIHQRELGRMLGRPASKKVR